MAEKTIVRLKIISCVYTPEQISSKLGLTSDSFWHIGETRPHTSMVHKDHGWIINSGLETSESLEAQMERLLEVLSPKGVELTDLSRDSSVEFSCVLYCSTPPALNFSRKWIRDLSKLGASLDIDLYITEENDGA